MPFKSILKYLAKSDMKSLGTGALMIAAVMAIAFVIWLTPQAKVGKILDNLLNPDNAVVLNWTVGSNVDGYAVTIVDIDDRSFHAWDQPPVTPRRELVGLVDAVLRRAPAVVIVDVDITATHDQGELDLTIAMLERLAADRAGPVVVLMRRLWSARPFAEVPSFGGSASRAAGERLAKIEQIVANSDRLIWASALHGVDGDGQIRKWRLAEAACNSAGSIPVRGFLTPYVIVASVMERPVSERQNAVVDLKRWSKAFADEACRTGVNARPEILLLKSSGGKLAYRSAAMPLPFYFAMFNREGAGFGALDDKRRLVPGLLVQSASSVLESEPTPALSSTRFCASLNSPAMGCGIVEARVVLVGASHIDSRDIHTTPLGPMAGVHIIANGILGAKTAIGLRPWYANPATFGACLFSLFWLGTKSIRVLGSSFASTLALAVLCVGFIVAAGLAGLDAARIHETVIYTLSIYGLYLVIGWAIAVSRKMPKAWVLLKAWLVGVMKQLGKPSLPLMFLGAALAATGFGPFDAVAQSHPPPSAGIVERIENWDGKPGVAMLQRGSESERRLILGEHVLPGDRIRAPNADTMIAVRRIRSVQEICKKNQGREACAGIVQADGGLLRNPVEMWRSVRELMRHYGTANAVNMATRSGDPPVFRFDRSSRDAQAQPQMLLRGTGSLVLHWSGGNPPFQVRVLGVSSGNEVLAEMRTDRHDATIALRAPITGNGRVEISEFSQVGSGSARLATLAIRVALPAPKLPDFTDFAPDEDTRNFMRAVWLAQQERGAFVLAALQLLEPIADRHPPSAALRAALRTGDRPD